MRRQSITTCESYQICFWVASTAVNFATNLSQMAPHANNITLLLRHLLVPGHVRRTQHVRRTPCMNKRMLNWKDEVTTGNGLRFEPSGTKDRSPRLLRSHPHLSVALHERDAELLACPCPSFLRGLLSLNVKHRPMVDSMCKPHLGIRKLVGPLWLTCICT